MNGPTDSLNESPCNFMQHGDAEKALLLSKERHAREHSPSSYVQLGVAFLWIGDYEAATEHFERQIGGKEKPIVRSEGDYLYLGTARWCVADYTSAVKHWQAGIKAPYAVGGVCTHSPLLLILASILRSGLFDRTNAEEMLSKKVNDPRAQYWPGTLAQYVAGLIDKDALEASWVGNISRYDQGVLPDRKWLTAFYKALLELGRGAMSESDFRQFLQTAVEPSQFESWKPLEFFSLTRHQEFYIARHEARRPA
jgi:hypothetical protein